MRRSGGLLAVAVVVAALIVTAVVALTNLDSGSSGTAAAPATSSAGATATSKQPAPAAPSSAAPAPSSSPVAQTSQAASTPREAVRKAITYRVKRGDNLTVIAAWFKLRGYGDLYERNKKIIGADPDLIRPGQKITISPAGVTMSR